MASTALLWRLVVLSCCWVGGESRATVWVVRPESGSIVEIGEQSVEIALRNHSVDNSSVCFRWSLAKDDMIGISAAEKKECFSVVAEAEGLISSSVQVSLRVEGWYYLEATVYERESLASTFGVGIYAAAPSSTNSEKSVGLAWDLGGGIGWGVAGLNLAIELAKRGARPIPLKRVHGFEMTLEQRQRLRPFLQRNQSTPSVIHALGRWGPNGSLATMDELSSARESRKIGLIFAETSEWSEDDIRTLQSYDALLAGSTWCAETIMAAGAAGGRPLSVKTFRQGIDPSIFYPASAVLRKEDEPFRIFSGGKLEWRKGHDIVVEAFKRLKKIVPQAQLVVAWVNSWPESLATMLNATYTHGLPAPVSSLEIGNRAATAAADRIAEWLGENGVEDAVSLPPLTHHRQLPDTLRSFDAALFPNRIEGGTNLVAMEAIAIGIPTVLSANTGHLDLIQAVGGSDNCWPLLNQTPSPQQRVNRGAYDSDPDEAARALADIYQNRRASRARALAAAARMRDTWSWSHTIHEITQAAFPQLS